MDRCKFRPRARARILQRHEQISPVDDDDDDDGETGEKRKRKAEINRGHAENRRENPREIHARVTFARRTFPQNRAGEIRAR